MKKVVKVNSYIVSKLIQVGLNAQEIPFILDRDLVLYVEDDQYEKILDIIRNFPFSIICAPCLCWYLDQQLEIPFTQMPILKAEMGEKLLQNATLGVSTKALVSPNEIDASIQNQLFTDLALWLTKETKGTFSSFSLDFPVIFEVKDQVLTVYYETASLKKSFSNFNQKILKKKNDGKDSYGEDLQHVREILSVFFEECDLDLKNIQYFDSYGNIVSAKENSVYQKQNKVEENKIV